MTPRDPDSRRIQVTALSPSACHTPWQEFTPAMLIILSTNDQRPAAPTATALGSPPL